MKHATILILSLFVVLLASACTVMAPIESAGPQAGVGQPVTGQPTQGDAPVSDNAPLENSAPLDAGSDEPLGSSAGDGAQPNPGPNAGAGDSSVNSPAQGSLSAEQFDAQLAQAIEAKDFAALRAMMGSQFVLAGWRSEGSQLSPDQAIAQLGQSALAPGAGPAVSFGVDPVPLLDFADPLKFFPPDAVRAFYVDFVGPNGTDQALVIVGRDPVSGQRYWKGLLVAMGGFRADDGGKTDLNQFSALLAQAVEQRDFTAMRGLMRERFSIATFDATLYEYTSEESLDQLRGGIFAPGSAPALRAETDVAALLAGRDPLGEWGPIARPVRAVHLTRLGSNAAGEAVLVIARDEATGRFYWHGVLLPKSGQTFRAGGDSGSDVVPTNVRFVMALEDLNVRSGPGLNYAVEGRVRSGEIATVSGKSPDSAWWRILCTQDASGHCWISARADLSQPVNN